MPPTSEYTGRTKNEESRLTSPASILCEHNLVNDFERFGTGFLNPDLDMSQVVRSFVKVVHLLELWNFCASRRDEDRPVQRSLKTNNPSGISSESVRNTRSADNHHLWLPC